MVKITMSPGWEKNLEAQIVKSPEWALLQERANKKAQAMIRDVNSQMAGQPSDLVLAELVARGKAAGFEPNVESMREYASAISNGTLK